MRYGRHTHVVINVPGNKYLESYATYNRNLNHYLWDIVKTLANNENDAFCDHAKELYDHFVPLNKDEIPNMLSLLSKYTLNWDKLFGSYENDALTITDVISAGMLVSKIKAEDGSTVQLISDAFFLLMVRAEMKLIYVRKEVGQFDGITLYFAILPEDKNRVSNIEVFINDLYRGDIKW